MRKRLLLPSQVTGKRIIRQALLLIQIAKEPKAPSTKIKLNSKSGKTAIRSKTREMKAMQILPMNPPPQEHAGRIK